MATNSLMAALRDTPAGELHHQVSVIWICSQGDSQMETTLRSYLKALACLEYRCELVVVGNFTDDRRIRETLLPVLEESGLASKIISLAHFCDESTAIQAGVQSCTANLIAIMPTYLDTDPEELSRLLHAIQEGVDYVASWRTAGGEPRWCGLRRSGFNRLTRYLTGVELHDLNSGLRVMRRELIENVPIYGGLHRFLPILAAWQGYRVTEVQTRLAGDRQTRPDYHFGVYWRRLLDLLTLFFLLKFTRKPLQFFGVLGGATIVPGLLIMAGLMVDRFQGVPLADRPLFVLGVLFIVLGVELFSLGLLGELIIFTHARSTKDYRVHRVFEKHTNHRP